MKQKIMIKLAVYSNKCPRKALKIAAATDGVDSAALEGSEKDKVVVIGDGIDAACLTNTLRKKVSYATLESVEEVKPKEKPKEEPKAKPKDEPKPKKPCSPCCDPRPRRCELY